MKTYVKNLRKAAFAAVAICATIGLAACSGDAPDGDDVGSGGPAELVPITVGVTPTSLSTGQYAAFNEGIFEEAGFDVTLHVQASLAESMPLLLSGELQYVWADTHNTILARTEGMPLVIGAAAIVAPEAAPESGVGSLNFIVAEESRIQGLGDFENTTVAVSALGGQAHLDVQTVLEREGVDLSTVEFIAIPPPQMDAAVRQGQVDIIALVEPLGTAAVQAGGVRMVGQTDDALPNAPMFVLAATEEFVNSDLEQAKRFEAALLKANALVNEDRDFANTVMESFLDMPAELITASSIPLFATKTLSEADLRPVAERLVKFGVIDASQVDVVAEMVPLRR